MLKYEEIAEDIIKSIKIGTYLPKAKVPSENQLAKYYNTSRITVRKAIGLAVTRGYLYSSQGKGTFVVDNSTKFEVDINDPDGFTKRTLKMGRTPTSKVIALQFKDADPYITSIFEKDDSQVFYFERIRYIDDIPLAIEYAYLNPDFIGDISLKDISNSFETYVESNDINIKLIKREMKAVVPNSEVANALGLESNTPVIRVDYTKHLNDGKILEYAKVFYNQNLFRFVHYIQNDN